MNRDQMILDNEWLVKTIARKEFKENIPYFFEYNDLVQYGYVGLLESIPYFKKGKNKFSSYASYRIKGAIKDAIRKNQSYNNLFEDLESIDVNDLIEENSNQLLKNDLLNNIMKNALSKKEYNIIQLYYIEHINQKEISEGMNLAQGQISKIKNIALKKMRKYVKKNKIQKIC